jgi:hypothetical protein
MAAPPSAQASFDDWNAVRAQFALSDDFIHMSAMLISSHPRPVREAIDEHRRGMDANPIIYLHRTITGFRRLHARQQGSIWVSTAPRLP